MNFTTDQKEAIKVLMNLYDKKHINEEQYFLLLDFIISDTRNEVKISELPWNTPKLPDMPITTIYGCPIDDTITYKQNCNKKEEQQ